MRHVISTSVIVLFMFFPILASAQRFGGTPPSVKWRQVNTDTVRIIYASGLDSQANRIANLVHHEAASQAFPIGSRLKKINIVLQNQTTIANGYVGLGPYRSEFYLTPSLNNFNLGSLPWGDQLATHEYRHVQQFNNFSNGLSNLMRVLFGEEGYALAVDASVPDWFFEGDAVYNETQLSSQGRGRLPLFLNAYPALWMADKNYSWMKLRNGSLKDYVPDHYNLGYFLVNYGYGKYGKNFWGKVTHDASAFKGLFYPFQKAIEKYAGISYQQFRTEALDSYRRVAMSLVKEHIPQEAGPAPVFPLNKKVLTNYLFPYRVDTGSTVYLKTSNQRRPAFFIHDETGEHWIRNRDISTDDQFSYRNGKIVYAAYQNDKRWRWRDYSVITLLDVDNHQSKIITRRSRYFSPDISASGTKIAAVNISLEGKSEIHLLDQNGKITQRIASSEINLFTDPKFINEDSLLTAVRLNDGRMALAVADLRTGSLVRITNPSYNVLGFPCIDGDVIYFTASYGGSDQVFALRRSEKKLYQLTDWPLGNYFVNVKEGKMNWSVLTADGYQLQQVNLSEVTWKPVSGPGTELLRTPYAVTHAGEFPTLLNDSLVARIFPTMRYAKSTRLINFHSWRPDYEDPEFTFSLYGENVLNTLETQLYYLYNENENTHAVGFNAIYGALFPYLSAGTQYTFGRSVTLQGSNGPTRRIQWNQLDTRVGVNIPLSWTSQQTNKQFNIGTDYVYREDFYRGQYKDSLANRGFSYLNHYIAWSQQVATATQHLFPRLGYAVTGNYRHVVSNIKSWQVLGNATVYLPGFLPTHSIVLRAGFQETDTMNALFANNLAYARGYNEAYFSRMWRLSANYHFPIIYPDWGFANILYLQRVRGNAFYDLTRVYSTDKTQTADQRSVGGEIYVDTKWWNQYELTFGFRVSHLLDRDFFTGRTGATVFEFIVPVSIFPR